MATNKRDTTEQLTIDPEPGRLAGVLGLVERLGNKLPNPFLLFVGLLVLIAVASFGAVCTQTPWGSGVLRSWRLTPEISNWW